MLHRAFGARSVASGARRKSGALLGAIVHPRVGTGGANSCDTSWVQTLLQQAQEPGCRDAAGPDTLPFPASGTVATGASSSVSATLQRNGFIGRRLVIPDSLSNRLVIDDVKVGGRSIFTSSNSITGEAFSTKADVCTWLRWPKISAGFTVVVYFTNIDPTSTVWAISTVYAAGAYVTANGNLYRATTGGTSAGAGGGPTGTGTAITDNTVVWTYVSPAALNLRGAYVEGVSW